jgi:Flp pilus assembly protein CpaB
LPAGHVLAPADLRLVRWPLTVRPRTVVTDRRTLVGRRLTGPAEVGEPLTAGRVLGRSLVAQLRPGLVAAPVVIDDPHAADLLHAGDRADLLSTPRPPDLGDSRPATSHVSTLVSGALVLAVFPASDGAATEIVLAVDRRIAVDISRDTATHVFTAITAPP